MNTRLGAFLFAGWTAFLAAAPVCAEPGDGRLVRRFWLRNEEVRNARAERIERRLELRQSESAYVRMSPEERRQLRHDIRAAREDVYRRGPPPPPPPSAPLPPGLHEEPPR